MADQAHGGTVCSWLIAGALTVVLALLVLTFPYQGVSGCPSRAILTTGGGGCVDNLLSWHGWVRYPHWDWLPWVHLAAMLGVLVTLVITVCRAVRAR